MGNSLLFAANDEYYNDKEQAERRAEYLRIGYFKNTEVIFTGERYIVRKSK